MIEVYGKPDCIWCDRTKTLLENVKQPYTYYSIGTDLTVDELKEKFPEVRSVPVIIVNGFRVGGYEDLRGYLEETSGGHSDNI